MKIRTYKILVCLLFMAIFFVKMIISVAPVFLTLNNKTVNAVIMQLEHENKNEKDDVEKESLKEKKFFDEDFQSVYQPVILFVIPENEIYLHTGHIPYTPGHHSSVPTPPPDSYTAA